MTMMNWNKLKENRCPNCRRELSKGLLQIHHECGKCGFSISHEKFEKIINGLYKPTLKGYPNDNFEALQNLGHEPIARDFSDSPYADRE